MANSWRIAALADKHRALGSNLEDWNGMPTAWTYSNSGYTLADEHEAIRTKAGLMDVSGLKKVHYVGPHAESLLEWATTRDISKLYPGKAVYATMLNDAGKFIDDCVIYRTGPNAFFDLTHRPYHIALLDGPCRLSATASGVHSGTGFQQFCLSVLLRSPLFEGLGMMAKIGQPALRV